MKQFVHLEVEKEGQLFTFSMPVGVKLGMAYDVAFEFLGKIVELSQQAYDKSNPEKKNEAPSTDVAL